MKGSEEGPCGGLGTRKKLLQGVPLSEARVSTQSAQALRLFQQGVTSVYAFNLGDAIELFRGAVELDPNFVMGYWGIAWASHGNFNSAPDRLCLSIGRKALCKALSLISSSHVKLKLTGVEKQLVNALRLLYAKNKLAYSVAMGAIYETRKNPKRKINADVATLYAESLLNLTPWEWWTKAGKPAPQVPMALSVLEATIKEWPSHIGANHYYIHAIEESPAPEKALPSAYLLERLGKRGLRSGHLVHMPSHIYILMSKNSRSLKDKIKWQKRAETVNALAVKRDTALRDLEAESKGNIPSFYIAHYLPHNLHFLAVDRTILADLYKRLADRTQKIQRSQNRYAEEAIQTSLETMRSALAGLGVHPEIEWYISTHIMMLVNFKRWRLVLRLPFPFRSNAHRHPLTLAVWAWGRSLAFLGLKCLQQAKEQTSIFLATFQTMREHEDPDMPFRWGLNSAISILHIAEKVLKAKWAAEKGDISEAESYMRSAIRRIHLLKYDEPTPWFIQLDRFLE